MRTHLFKTEMDLPLDIHAVFKFFCDATNLEKITPPELCFHIISAQPIQIKKDTYIDYRLRLYGIPFHWRAKISAWEPPIKFIDEQVIGPYTTWIHTHTFIEKNGRTGIIDEILYRMPFWPIGEIFFPVIAMYLRRIFAYRKQNIKQIFSNNNPLCNEGQFE